MSTPPGDQAADELLDLLVSYQRYLRVSEVSPATTRTYSQSVRRFADFLRGHPAPPPAVEAIARAHLEDWVMALREAGQAPSTVHTRFCNVRTFLRWLVREGELDATPTDGIREPAASQEPVAVLSVDAVRAMLEGCDASFIGRRDEALIRAYVDGGMRLAECGFLGVEDADLEQQVFWVQGKGGKPRAVPFGDRTARALDRYLRARRKHAHAKQTSRLWLGRQGAIGPEGIRVALRKRAKAVGLEHFHPHQLRHTAAHQLRLAGMNDQDMKRIFGWRSGRMLERYGESAADERAQAAHRRLSFGDQL